MFLHSSKNHLENSPLSLLSSLYTKHLDMSISFSKKIYPGMSPGYGEKNESNLRQRITFERVPNKITRVPLNFLPHINYTAPRSKSQFNFNCQFHPTNLLRQRLKITRLKIRQISHPHPKSLPKITALLTSKLMTIFFVQVANAKFQVVEVQSY